MAAHKNFIFDVPLESKHFFFEKKKQKTFNFLAAPPLPARSRILPRAEK